MEVITRAAPTISGRLHLGTLYNALLNYAYARQNDGAFFLRLDGQKVGDERRRVGEQIIVDLEAFGMRPDKIIWQCDRKTLYRERIEGILDDPRVYACDCTVGDIFERTRFQTTTMRALIREEKYPGPCEIRRIKVFDANRKTVRHDMATAMKASASIEAEGHEARFVTDDSENFWNPYEVGALGDRHARLTIDLGRKVWVGAMEIQWNFYPVKSYRIRIPDGLCIGDLVAVSRQNKFVVPTRTEGAYEGAVADQLSFTPVKTRFIVFQVDQPHYEIKREYCYDDHCRDLKKEKALRNARTVLRVKSKKPKDFQSGAPLDVAIYFNRLPDLCFTSAIDDQEYGISHVIRGSDIEPFAQLEKAAGRLLGYRPNNLFHGMVVDNRGVKLSKFVESQPAVEKLEAGSSPNEVLTNLAKSAGLISWKSDLLSLPQLVEAIDFSKAFSTLPIKPNFEYRYDW